MNAMVTTLIINVFLRVAFCLIVEYFLDKRLPVGLADTVLSFLSAKLTLSLLVEAESAASRHDDSSTIVPFRVSSGIYEDLLLRFEKRLQKDRPLCESSKSDALPFVEMEVVWLAALECRLSCTRSFCFVTPVRAEIILLLNARVGVTPPSLMSVQAAI